MKFIINCCFIYFEMIGGEIQLKSSKVFAFYIFFHFSNLYLYMLFFMPKILLIKLFANTAFPRMFDAFFPIFFLP